MKQRWFPWLIALATMLVLMVSNGMVLTGLTAFDKALLAEFGWERGDLKLRDLLTLLLTGLLAPFIGILIDRLGVRVLMIGGSVLLSAAYFAYGTVNTLGQVYAIHVLFAAVLVACGLNVAVILVSQWFVAHRGTAIGLALVGTSLGGVFLPPIFTAMIADMGWREAFAWASTLPLLMLMIGIFLAKRPEAFGLTALGAGSALNTGARAPDARNDASLGQALRTRTFWALATVACATFYSMLGVVSSLILHLTDMGMTPQSAAIEFSLMMTMALIGKFVFGLLADRLPVKWVFLGNITVMLIGAVFLAQMELESMRWAALLFGLGWGGLYTLLQIQAINNFGLTAAGKILGVITVLDAAGGGLGMWLTNELFSQTGSYQMSYQIIVGLMILALVAATQIGRRRVNPAPL